MKLERHNITTPAREIKRIVLNSLTPRFPNETCMYAMNCDFELKEWAGSRGEVLVGTEKERPVPSVSRRPCGRRPNRDWRWSPWTRSARQALRRRHDDGRGRNQQGHPRQMNHGQQHQPPAAMSQQSHAWQQQQQPRFPQLQQQGPHQQSNPWSSWGRPPTQQRRGRAHHQRRLQHWGGDQSHQQRVMCQQCGEEEHFLADCAITHARTNATASFICGIIFRSPCCAVRYRRPCRAVQHWSPCRAVPHSPPSSLDITRQRWTIDLFNLRASAASRQFCTCPADATAAQIFRAFTSAGTSLGFRLELLLRAIPGSTGTIRTSRRTLSLDLTDRRTDGGSVGGSYLCLDICWTAGRS